MSFTRLSVLSLALCAMLFALCSVAYAAGPGATDVKWKDNSTNELTFEIERHEQACGATGAPAFGKVATVPTNTTAWVDASTVIGKAYCFRVRACNNSLLDGSGAVQCSGYTNEAGVAYPLVIPADPSEATAQ